MPWQIIDTQKGCLIDTVRTYQIGFDTITTDVLSRVQFTLNQHKYIVSRVVGKLDDLLSYAGGLFSIIIGFFAFFLMSYN
ncbi:MAG TPA: hypothetical protein PLD02_11840 [Saprospiraceae bacterium]|nr:hypothetical protein [Saprospiraceae bacterium]